MRVGHGDPRFRPVADCCATTDVCRGRIMSFPHGDMTDSRGSGRFSFSHPFFSFKLVKRGARSAFGKVRRKCNSLCRKTRSPTYRTAGLSPSLPFTTHLLASDEMLADGAEAALFNMCGGLVTTSGLLASCRALSTRSRLRLDGYTHLTLAYAKQPALGMDRWSRRWRLAKA